MVLPPENMNDDFRALTGLERICRTCLSEKNFEDLRSLFDRSLGAQLSEITAVKVEPNDGLPSNMCSDCYLTLNLAINFKDQCWKSENHLRSALSPSQTLYRSITILGSNTEDLRIQNFDDLDSSLLKHGTINHELLLPESIEITSNFGNGKHESEMIFIQTEIPEKKDNYINTSIPDSLEHIICSNKVEKAQIVPNTLVQSCDNGLDNSTKFENNQVIPGPGVQAGVLQKENIFIDPNIPVPLDLIECVSTEMPDTGNTIENGNCNIVAVSDKTENTQNEQHKDEQLPKVALQEPKHSSRIFFDCQYCEKYFKNAAALEIHLLKHGKKLKCEVCTMKIFRDHIIKHKDYRPFGCKVCGKSFSAPASLTKHMRIHEGKRKYLCTICGKRFYELTHLTVGNLPIPSC
ncbi:hypothetical protein NQ317_013902 [Molorchus minor]|uniref:Uncharacterized protein n=1 Tax=Molorchus minor TaxID=1323400 RepID=A0ABQ9K8R0_9CUCU|nr:hypothetical protein NQ317_013902 [Molorchus minor]